jgi:hypothetical protein
MATNNLIKFRESASEISLTVPKPSLRYLDEFVTLKCAPDLLTAKIFPDAKEITESMAAFNAYRRHLMGRIDINNPRVLVIAVGDGIHPRTSSLFAMRTKFTCISVDPALKIQGESVPLIKRELINPKWDYSRSTRRVMMLNAKVSELSKHIQIFAINLYYRNNPLLSILAKFSLEGALLSLGPINQVLWVGVHSHAPWEDVLNCIKTIDPKIEHYIISIPCCYPDKLDTKVNLLQSYIDMGIHSEMRIVNVYEVKNEKK